MSSNTPSPPRRLSDDDPDENMAADTHTDEKLENIKSEQPQSPPASPPARSLPDPVKQEKTESPRRSESPQRVLSPSEDRPRSTYNSYNNNYQHTANARPYRTFTTRTNNNATFKRIHPNVQDQIQLKTLLKNATSRSLLTRFIKQRLSKNEDLQIDFMQYLEQNVDAMRDSELYSKLREYIYDHGYTSASEQAEPTSSDHRCGTRMKDIRAVLPVKHFDPDIALEVGCVEGSISAELRTEFPLLRRVVGTDTRDVRSDEHSSKFEFILLDGKFKLDTLEDESVDLAVCPMSLHHMENVEATLDELRRVMKRGSFLVIQEHDCFKDDLRLFLDVAHAMNSIVFADSPEEDFCDNYKSNFRSKRQWESLLEKKRFFLFKDTSSMSIFNTFYASFKKDVQRGVASRKRSLLPTGAGGAYGMGGPGAPYGMPQQVVIGLQGPHPNMQYGGAPGGYPGQQQAYGGANAGAGGPPMKRRRFNTDAPQGFHQGPGGANAQQQQPIGRAAYFNNNQQDGQQQQQQPQQQRGGARQGGNRRSFHGGPGEARSASPYQQQQQHIQQQPQVQQPYQQQQPQQQPYYQQQNAAPQANQWNNAGAWGAQQQPQAQWNGYGATQQQQMTQAAGGYSRAMPTGDFRSQYNTQQQRGAGTRQAYGNGGGYGDASGQDPYAAPHAQQQQTYGGGYGAGYQQQHPQQQQYSQQRYHKSFQP